MAHAVEKRPVAHRLFDDARQSVRRADFLLLGSRQDERPADARLHGMQIAQFAAAHKGELDNQPLRAEPAARGLKGGWNEKEREVRRRQCPLRADARFRHRPSPQLPAVLGCEMVDATTLSPPADAVRLDVPNFWP